MHSAGEARALPLVTVVTVTYNSAAYVRRAIASVLGQSYPNIEYVIGDDASKDDTWSIISEFNDPRVKAYRNESNLGEYANRNKAIGLASGKYLMFVDGDDLIYARGIEFFVEMATAYPHAGLVVQKGYLNNVVYPVLLGSRDVILNFFYGRQCLLSSSFASNFFVTAILKEEMLATRFASGDDEIRLRIAARSPVLFVAGWVSWPRETPNQASSRISEEESLAERYRYSREQLVQGKAGEVTDPLARDIHAMLRRHTSRFALRHAMRGRFALAARALKDAQLRWRDVFRYAFHRPAFSDPLGKYSPQSPLIDERWYGGAARER